MRIAEGLQINYPFRLGTCAPRRRGGQVRFLNGRIGY
jgi:hypothetical protein